MSYWRGPGWSYIGTGDPQGQVTAVVGSVYRRTDGGVGTTFYVKETGTGNTGWSPVGGRIHQPLVGAILHLPGLAADYLSAPNPAAWTPADLDIRAVIAPDDWTTGQIQALVSDTDSGASDVGWYFYINNTNHLTLAYSTNGSAVNTITSTVITPGAVDGQKLGVRCTFDVADAGNPGFGLVTFYTSGDGGATWVSFDTKPTTGTAAVHKSAHRLSVGIKDSKDFPFKGSIWYAEARDGIGGAVVFSVDFRGNWTGTDAQGNVWALSGSGTSWALLP